MPKYPNIVGTGFPDFIQNQINIRSNIIGSESRDGETLSYLNNKTGWFRMSSAAIIEGSDNLAKNNILQGGIVSRNDNNSITLRKSFNEKYTKGNDDDLGLRPMPGITGLSVGTGGKWQTIQESEVQFTCYNLDQLNIMSQLYMSLGVQVFIEYGHLPYYDNNNSLKSKVDTINFFDFAKNPKGREDLIKSITKKEEDTHGNYGALMGYVFNFNYTANPDGSYTCSSKVIGPGHLAESLTINNNTGFFAFDERNTRTDSEDNKSDLEHIISSLISFAEENTFDLSRSERQGTTKARFNKKFSFLTPDSFQNLGKESYPTLLNRVYQNSELLAKGSKINFEYENDYKFGGSESLLGKEASWKINDDNLKFGNATQIINGLSETDDLKPIGLGKDNTSPWFFDIIQTYTDGGDKKKSHTYITLGHLFFLVQNFGMIVSEDGDIAETNLKLDHHPDNTIIKSGVIQGTINPFVCAIPLKVSNGETWSNFFGGVEVNSYNNLEKLFHSEDNARKNVINRPETNQLNNIIDYINVNDENDNIKIFNVLVNLGMVLDVFEQLANLRDDRKVYLIPFLDKVLSKMSAALGGVNNLRMSVDKNNHVLRVVDEHRLKSFNNTDDLITIPVFGKNSVALNYNYSAQISNNLAKQVVVAAQAINNEGQDTNGGLKAFPDEVLSYNYLNGGVTDRFVDLYNRAEVVKDEVIEDIWIGKYQKLFDHITDIYRLKFENDNVFTSLNFTKAYIDRQQIRKNFIPSKSATILMPLALTIRLDGITGIRPYNAFKIPDNRLPLRYRGKIGFIVYSINHIFENNKWFTELVGQTIYLNEEEPIAENCSPTDLDINPPPYITPDNNNREPENASYPITPDGFSTSSPKPEGKASPTKEDEQENNNINPPIDGSQNNNQGEILLESNPNFGSPVFTTSGNDVIGATELISNNEVPGGRPLLTAYKDRDYTNKDGFTYRIGFGSDTITSPNGSVRRVQKGDTITTSMASADLNRRITQEFKPKVVAACQNNGVFYPSLPDCVKAVFIDIAYNYGTLWNSIVIAYRDGGKQGLINELKRRAEQGPSQVPSRRYAEINYLNTRC